MREDMTEQELETYKSKLQQLSQEYLAQIQDLEDINREETADLLEESGDSGDEAAVLYSENTYASQIQTLHELRILVEAALQRINAGAYGQCLDCGHAIDLRRLAAIPYAQYCLQDQAKHE